MSDAASPRSTEKSTIAVLKGGPDYAIWFRRLQDQTRLPAALLLDAALVEFAKAKGFTTPA